MYLLYRNGEGNIVAVFYKVYISNVLLHTIRLKDGAKLNVYDRNLQILYQPGFYNMPKTPLSYRK